ncbi:MAG: hypothetical protein ACRCTQ_05045 [Brevinemataceae bacterium]
MQKCILFLLLFTINYSYGSTVIINNGITVNGHMKATDIFHLEWPTVKQADTYNIYQVFLCNKTTQVPSGINKSFFDQIDSTSKNHVAVKVHHIPIRRYIFYVEALDNKGLVITNFSSSIVYRYPKDVKEFMKDVDFTMAHAHRQIQNFGLAGSKATIKGLVEGTYDYFADVFNAKSKWNNFTSFEVTLTGDPRITMVPFPIGAEMTGNIKVSGLYQGEIIYNKLLGQNEGVTAGGSITARYQHPEKGWIEKTFDYKDASKFLKTVVLSRNSIQNRRNISYQKGYHNK